VSWSQTKFESQWECQHLFLTFMQLLDNREAERAIALVMPDVIWHRQGKELVGRDAIRAVVCDRPPNRVIRHLLSNIVVTLEHSAKARSVAYYAVYSHEGADLPGRIGGPERIGDYHAAYVRTPEGWRIAYLRAQRVFAAEPR
jgi:hypothetical protein